MPTERGAELTTPRYDETTTADGPRDMEAPRMTHDDESCAAELRRLRTEVAQLRLVHGEAVSWANILASKLTNGELESARIAWGQRQQADGGQL